MKQRLKQTFTKPLKPVLLICSKIDLTKANLSFTLLTSTNYIYLIQRLLKILEKEEKYNTIWK